MKYELEYFAEHPDLIRVHVDERLIRGEPLDSDDLRYAEKKFRKKAINPDALVAFLKTVRMVNGMEYEFDVSCYSLQLKRARLFAWKDLVPEVIEAIRLFLTPRGELEEFSKQKEESKTKKVEKAKGEVREEG